MATMAMDIDQGGNRLRRFMEVTAAVAVWLTISLVFHLDSRGHLLLGIAVIAAFQWGVRRQPLRTLWLRNGTSFHLDAAGWGIALLLALYPGYCVFSYVHSGAPWGKIGLGLATVAGAFPCAYSLRNFRRSMLRPFLLCLATAGGLGVAVMIALAVGMGMEHYTLLMRVQIGVTSMLRYVPIGFVVEEVSFRGAFDAHIHHPGESHGVLSALFVSALWGLWHLPGVNGQMPLKMAIPMLVIVHSVLGLPLSIYWRRSGNLIVPSVAHALADAVRNALVGGPA